VTKWSWIMIVIAVIIAVALFVTAQFVDDIQPFIRASGTLILLNIFILGYLHRRSKKGE